MTIQSEGLLRTKPHFQMLDGLRGVAALCIVVFHFMEMIFTDYSKNFIGHGFLAVDFFFCLSGFVIGYAYDDRIGKMGVWAFFKSRLIRLHPLVILGSVLGVCGFLYNPFGVDMLHYGVVKTSIMFICSVLLIPYPIVAERGFGLFALNTPSWSLFFEYVFNILYAFLLFKTGRRILIILTITAGVFLLFIAQRSGTLIGGWDGNSIIDGLARITFSFLAGLLVFRLGFMFKNRLGFAGLSILLILSFMMPYFKWNWLAESIVVLFLYPLLIAMGAGAVLSKPLEKLCIFFGKISYPIYMTHIWAIWWFGDYVKQQQPSNTELTVVIISGTLLLMAFAYFIMVIYDIPVRRYLTGKRRS